MAECIAFTYALVDLPISSTWLQGELRRSDLPRGGSDELYGEVTQVTNGDSVRIQAQSRTTSVRAIGINTPNTVAPDEPIGCFGKVPNNYIKRMLADRLVCLEIPRIGNSEDAYGHTLADVYLDANDDGRYEYIYNEYLIELG
jgi:endonuclease YncB( thermonuclease family)